MDNEIANTGLQVVHMFVALGERGVFGRWKERREERDEEDGVSLGIGGLCESRRRGHALVKTIKWHTVRVCWNTVDGRSGSREVRVTDNEREHD